MSNNYFDWPASLNRFVPFDAANAGDVNDALDNVSLGFDDVQSDIQTLDSTKAPLNSPAFTGTPTAPTPATSDDSTKVATTAFAKALVATVPSGSLPAMAGNALKRLRVNASETGVEWSATAGEGGTTSTGNTTLTSTSAGAQSIATTTFGQSVTLPDATTCIESAANYNIFNNGDYPLCLKNAAGNKLGWIPARRSAMVGLADNSTAAGVWSAPGILGVAVTAEFHTNTALSGFAPNRLQAIELDASRTLFLTGSTTVYAVVYDDSTQTWGAITAVRATITADRFSGVKVSSSQVLVASVASNTALEVVSLSISGTTITVDTAGKASATLAGNISTGGVGMFIPVGTSYVLAIGRATTTQSIFACTVSGTTVSIGAESVVGSGSESLPPSIFAAGSVVRCAYTVASNATLGCRPYTVSGTTLSAGSGTSFSATSTSPYRVFPNGNGNLVFQYLNTTHYATICKLTGTTEAASSIDIGTAPTNTNYTACANIGSNKTVFIGVRANILTDTNGTASAGTEINPSAFGVNNAVHTFGVSGSSVRVASSSTSIISQATIDCSGASPVLTSLQRMPTSSAMPVAGIPNNDANGAANGRMLYGAGSGVVLGSTSGGVLATVKLLANRIERGDQVLTEMTDNPTFVSTSNPAVSWCLGEHVVSTAAAINRVECAA